MSRSARIKPGSKPRARQSYWRAAKVKASGCGAACARWPTRSPRSTCAAAIADYTGALDQIESTRAGLGATSARTTYFSTKLSLYDDFIQYLWQLNARFPGKGYDRQALQILERKQAREALEQIGRSAARQFAGVPESVVTSDTEAELAVDDARTMLTYTEAV